ncbi:hypothetical protein [Herbaspirillum sp. YR522]|uniref:hypothetical protein n=1 Tax=Herbaspirillum sp. YR522 TaxID=1144342 RepID=UPI0012FB5F2B|nr:hypothetical protein [Herbaspirillum sp. YR522]
MDFDSQGAQSRTDKLLRLLAQYLACHQASSMAETTEPPEGGLLWRDEERQSGNLAAEGLEDSK